MSSSSLINPSEALPNRFFRDDSLYSLEQERVWGNDWVFVGTEADISQPGDRFPVLVGHQPVLLIRTKDGELVALSNLCAHRGTLLVDEAVQGASGKIVCPYHAWVYDDQGNLNGVAHDPQTTVDRAKHCLPRYRVEVWNGLVFVSLTEDVEPLADRFALLDPYIEKWGVSNLVPWPSSPEEEIWDCNWKLAILNAMESYHIFRVHAETLQPITPTAGAYYIAGSARCSATGGKSKGGEDYLLVSLPPGFVGIVDSNAFLWQAVAPLAVNRTRVFTGGAFEGHPKKGGFLEQILGGNDSAAYGLPNFLPEDKAICERGQRGAIGDFKPGPILPIERIVSDFHHYLNWRLNGVSPPPSHTASSQ